MIKRNMKNAAKQYSFIKKDTVLTKYSNCFKGVKDGSPNGFIGIKNKDLKVSGIRAVPQKESGEKLLSIWLRRYSPSGKSWSLTEPDVLLSLALELRLSIGNLSRERFPMFHLSLLLPIFSLVTGRLRETSPRGIAIINHILTLRPRRWETSIRQTLLAHDISEVQKALLDSIPSTLWMWQVIRSSQASLAINKLFLSANILLKHGDLWAFPRYPRWIMRCLPQVEDAILTVFSMLLDCTCSWEFIWYSFRKENREGMPLLRVLINSGRRESFAGIPVLHLLPLKERMNNFCGIIIMRNHTGALHKKNTVQDTLEFSEIISGNLLDTCQMDSILINIWIPMAILISLLQKVNSPLSEKLTLMVELMLMGLLISSGENLKGNMWLLLSSLIERDWLLNKRIRLSNLSLFQLRVMLLLLCFLLQRRRSKEFPMLLYF